MYGGDIVLPRTGSDEPVPSVTPCWTGVGKFYIYESSDQIRSSIMLSVQSTRETVTETGR